MKALLVPQKLTKGAPIDFSPHRSNGISFSKDKTLAFVPLYKLGEVVIIDVAERKVIKKVKVGDELHNSVIVQINEN